MRTIILDRNLAKPCQAEDVPAYGNKCLPGCLTSGCLGLSWWDSGNESSCQCRRCSFDPLSWEDLTCHQATKPVHLNYQARALERGSRNY